MDTDPISQLVFPRDVSGNNFVIVAQTYPRFNKQYPGTKREQRSAIFAPITPSQRAHRGLNEISGGYVPEYPTGAVSGLKQPSRPWLFVSQIGFKFFIRYRSDLLGPVGLVFGNAGGLERFALAYYVAPLRLIFWPRLPTIVLKAQVCANRPSFDKPRILRP